MAIASITPRRRTVNGAFREVIADISLQASYVAAGETLSAGDLAKLMPEIGSPVVGSIEQFTCEPTGGGTAFRTLVLNRATGKLMAFVGGAEATAGTDQSGAVRCRVVYDGSVYG